MKSFLFIAAFLFAAQTSFATTRIASSCAVSDVLATISNSASIGDTVLLPACNQHWATRVDVSGKNITITGAGIDLTNITDDTTDCALCISASAANFVVASGMTFTAAGSHTARGVVEVDGTQGEVAFRLHHLKVVIPSAVTRGIFIYNVYGLIDNSQIIVTSPTGSIQGIAVDGSKENTDGGYTPWTRDLSLGTANAVYIEHNTFDYTLQPTFQETAIDGYSGARIVARFNTVLNNWFGTHGTDSGGLRSTVSIEAYNNTFTNNGSGSMQAFVLRGGTAMIFNNSFGGSAGYSGLHLMNYRATIGTGFTWNFCDGTVWDVGSSNLSADASRTTVTRDTVVRFLASPKETLSAAGTLYFDGSGSHGYPCRDQVGRSPGQALAPVYGWNNGSQGLITFNGGETFPPNNIGQSMSLWIAANRDFYDYDIGFTGATGVGQGSRLVRPGSCTTGTAYFSTNAGSWNSSGSGGQGVLDLCTATNVWTNAYYVPYAYPHPLASPTPAPIQSGISIVQCTTPVLASTVTSSSASFATTPIVGNKIKILMALYANSGASGSLTVTDNQTSNTYAVDPSATITSTNTLNRNEIQSGYVVASSGTYTLTVSKGGATIYISWIACEVSGLLPFSSFDKKGTHEALSTNTNTVTASAPNSQANEIVFAIMFNNGGGLGTSTPDGYTELFLDTTVIGADAAYKIINGVETSTATWVYQTGNSLSVLTTDKSDASFSIIPSTGLQGQTEDVVINGIGGTNWSTAKTTVSFGIPATAGITVNTLTCASTSVCTANITIDPAAQTGARTVTMTTAP